MKPSIPQPQTERNYLAVVVKPEDLKRAGVSLDRIWAEIKSIVESCGRRAERGENVGFPRSLMLGFYVSDLTTGLDAATVALSRLSLVTGAEVGHLEAGIWRTVWPVGSKPFSRHFWIPDVLQAKRFFRRLGAGAFFALVAFCVFLIANWRVVPWLTVPAVWVIVSWIGYMSWRSWKRTAPVKK